MAKINKITWIINLSLFIAVVFMGIEQAGRGAEIAKLENKDDLLSLGFVKPATVYYFNTEDSFAKLPVK